MNFCFIKKHPQFHKTGLPTRLLRQGIFGALILLILCLLWTALHLRLEYFDNYTVLSNARAIARFEPELYYWKRFILLPICLAPLFYLEKIFFADPFGFVSSHVFSVGLYGLLIWSVYRLARQYLTKDQALIAAGLLAFNRLLIHFAPFVKEDIPATLLITAGFYFYGRNQKKFCWHYYLYASLCWGGAMAMRYNVIPPLLLALFCLECRALWNLFRKGLRVKALFRIGVVKVVFSAVIPLTIFLIIPAILYGYLDIVPFFKGPEKIILEIMKMREMNLKPEEPFQNIMFIGRSMTWPLFAAAVAGIGLLLKKRDKKCELLVWPMIYLVYQSFVIFNKEARYLFPILPQLYIVAVAMLARSYQVIHKIRWVSGNRVFMAAAAVALCTGPIYAAVKECSRFLNPIYSAGYARQVSETAMQMAKPGGHIYWIGPMYSLHDRDPVFDLDDEATYIYHMYNHTLGFYANDNIHGFSNLDVFTTLDEQTGKVWVVPIGVGREVADGDVLVINLDLAAHNTRTLPKEVKPLALARARQISFEALSATGGNKIVFAAKDWPGLRLELTTNKNGKRVLRGAKGLPAWFFEIYILNDQKEILWQGFTKADKAGLSVQLESLEPQNPKALFLMTYDRIQFMAQPT